MRPALFFGQEGKYLAVGEARAGILTGRHDRFASLHQGFRSVGRRYAVQLTTALGGRWIGIPGGPQRLMRSR